MSTGTVQLESTRVVGELRYLIMVPAGTLAVSWASAAHHLSTRASMRMSRPFVSR